MSSVQQKYLKDENNEIFSPIVSTDSILTPDGKRICDLIYPVGSIYISVNSINPSIFFGGTWEEIANGRFLVGRGCPTANNDGYFGEIAGLTYNIQLQSTGGQDYHTLTVNEMPSHVHKTGIQGNSAGSMNSGSSSATVYFDQTLGMDTTVAGGGARHNNMPPYFGVCFWKRTA